MNNNNNNNNNKCNFLLFHVAHTLSEMERLLSPILSPIWPARTRAKGCFASWSPREQLRTTASTPASCVCNQRNSGVPSEYTYY